MSRAADIVQLTPLPRRGLRLPMAAQYVGVSPTKFLEWVEARTMPPPIRVDGVVMWDIRALDIAFDKLSEDADAGEDTWAHLG